MGQLSNLGPIKMVFMLGAAMALQGCIAAAIPVAAGGLLGGGSFSKSADDLPKTTRPKTTGPKTTGPETRGPENSGSEIGGSVEVAASDPVQTVASSAPSPSNSEPAPATTAPKADVVRPLPTPVPSSRVPLEPEQGVPTAGTAGINQFLSYANQSQITSGEEPFAAMLSDRISLAPVKAQCGGVTPTILIDLDPENGLFDPATAIRPPSGLAGGLARLRLAGIDVAWISGNGVDKLDAINRTLAFSGLDINNEDRILLVRGGDDRKQALREDLAQISCLIAIAGDTRSDFDELYDYLKNPSDAKSLEPLIGDGWFLIEQPLL